jgi:hypothetical protein
MPFQGEVRDISSYLQQFVTLTTNENKAKFVNRLPIAQEKAPCYWLVDRRDAFHEGSGSHLLSGHGSVNTEDGHVREQR